LQGTFCSLLRAGLHLFQNENDEQPAKLKLESSRGIPTMEYNIDEISSGFIGSLKNWFDLFF
jgi:hypothetical protein